MLAALRSRCSSLPSLFTSSPSPSLLDQSWKLGLSASNRIFASSPSFSSSAGARDTLEVLTVPEVEKILADVKADNVIVIPTHNQSCWADITIIATGRSDWHLKNIAQALVYRAKQKQIGAKHVMLPSVQGYNSKWIVIDYGKFVVHALDEKAKVYFNLESLWISEASAIDNSDKVNNLHTVKAFHRLGLDWSILVTANIELSWIKAETFSLGFVYIHQPTKNLEVGDGIRKYVFYGDWAMLMPP